MSSPLQSILRESAPRSQYHQVDGLMRFKQTKMTFDKALQAFEENPSNISSLINLLRCALEPVPNDLDEQIEELLGREMKQEPGQIMRVIATGSEVLFSESSEYSISFPQKFQAREKILDYVREKVRRLIEEIIAISENKDNQELVTDHVFRDQIRILLALEPFFVPKSVEDHQLGGHIKTVCTKALQVAGAYEVARKDDMHLTPFQIQAQETNDDLAMHNLQSQLEEVDKSIAKAESDIAKAESDIEEIRQIQQSIQQVGQQAANLGQLELKECALREEIRRLYAKRFQHDLTKRKVMDLINKGRPKLSLEGFKKEVENNHNQNTGIFQTALEIQQLEEESLKPEGFSDEEWERLDALKGSLGLQKKSIMPLNEILEMAAKELKKSDKKISSRDSSFNEQCREFLRLAHFLSTTYSASLVSLQKDLTLETSRLETKVARLIYDIKGIQERISRGESIEVLVTQQEINDVVQKVKGLLNSRKEQVLIFVPQEANLTQLQEIQEEISEQLGWIIGSYPENRASSISFLTETEYTYLPDELKLHVRHYLESGIKACSDQELQGFVSELLENRMQPMSKEEKVNALLSANLEHLPQVLRQFKSKEEASTWLESLQDQEIQTLMDELMQNQMPKEFDRNLWIQMFLDADYSYLPVVVKSGIKELFVKGLSITDDLYLSSFVQTVVLNQLQEISVKLTSLAGSYHQDEKIQISAGLHDLAIRIAAYVEEFKIRQSPGLLEDLKAMKAQLDHLLPRQPLMKVLDRVSTQVDELASMLSGTKV